MIEVFVESIRVNMTNYKRVVMLKEKTAQRYLPIWIGHFEADAIAIPMQNVPVSRPLTHDLLGSVDRVAGRQGDPGRHQRAGRRDVLREARSSTTTAVTSRSTPARATPSPWRSARKVPIFVEDAVLDQAGMVFESEGDADEPTQEAAHRRPPR